MPNTAKITIDEKTKPTGTTETKVPEPILLKLQKKIVENGQLVDQNQTTQEKTYQYRLDYTIPNDIPYEKMEVGDTLEAVLNLKGVKVLDEKDKDITEEGTLTVDVEKNSFSWSPTDTEDFSGKSFYVLIDASVKKDSDLSKYKKEGVYVIPNKAYLSLNEDKQETNQVTTLVPIPTPVKPEKKAKEPKQEKTVIPTSEPVQEIPKTGTSGTGYKLLDFFKNLF
ncbi:hypothetical protein MFLO_04330 [Listeria floridensis FSL S10-1187]|uniref:Adhesin isopeptide-forming adherence domain-containing protein n=1 Tax=Listeria floridensis FSL S10-1187 TaxID=1265817 RepID=A0ABN0RGV2_9LIST|nr:isopeptide-forming domain-containing fimbrial protein [Listeria floridensis]EUJ33139.1 hypothetical protein MFLO_04330 [Listeria floridensis FSL S10-1187]